MWGRHVAEGIDSPSGSHCATCTLTNHVIPIVLHSELILLRVMLFFFEKMSVSAPSCGAPFSLLGVLLGLV